jgi:hypothetical protein
MRATPTRRSRGLRRPILGSDGDGDGEGDE